MADIKPRITISEPTPLEVVSVLEAQIALIEDSHKSGGRLRDVDYLWERECLRKAIRIVKAS